MNRRFSQLFDKSFLKFLAVGVLNTLLGAAIMYGLYNLAGWSYWPATLANYIPTSILSFFLNRSFTFRDRETGWRPAVRFGVNIAVCYALAYGIAQPIVSMVFSSAKDTVRDNLSMLAGMGFFTLLNYFGQKFFTFRHRDTD